MKSLNINKSKSFLNRIFLITSISSLLFPILFFSYFKLGEKNFVENTKYTMIVTDEGFERYKRLRTLKAPLTNVNGIKKWLRIALLDLYRTNLNNYDSDERWKKVNKYFTPSAAKAFWSKDMERQVTLLSESYILSDVAIRFYPKLVAEGKNEANEKLWKFYVEVGIESFSRDIATEKYENIRLLLIVKEMSPQIKSAGVAIAKIEIK